MTHFIVAPKVWENFQMIDCFGEYESLTINELIEVLQLLDHEYHNKAGLVSDQLYDELWQHAYANAPHHSYFKSVGSRVGSDVRGGKIKLPFKMGSLNQVYIGEIESWVKDNNLEHHTIVISDKLDGTSGMALYSRTLQIGYSRGDGVEGADITRHFTRMSSIPKQVDSCGNMNVRGENIISHANFPGLQVASKRAKPFANPRNAVAGIMNSSENDDIIYDFVDFVAYDIVGSDVLGKHNTLSLLKASGFKIPWYVLAQGNQLTDEILADILNKRRAESPYQIDGLVLDVDCPVKRDEMNKGNDGLNPKFSIKYKVADEDNIADAVCEYVEWNLSKHRYFKPRLKIEPIQLCGVTVSYAQGFNAKFIKDNNIGPGSIIKITRAGDVIPHIVGGG